MSRLMRSKHGHSSGKANLAAHLAASCPRRTNERRAGMLSTSLNNAVSGIMSLAPLALINLRKNMRSILVTAAVAIALVGCATTANEPIKMYPGEALPHNQLVTLHPPTIGTATLVLRIDGETPTSCLSSCMFLSPVQVLPGKHKFTSKILHMPDSKERNSVIAKAQDSDRLHPLTPAIQKSGLFWEAYEFDFDETLEPGKHYQLKFATTTTADDWRAKMVTWWEEVSAK